MKLHSLRRQEITGGTAANVVLQTDKGGTDTLGSGMRNLYKYTKLYSHAEPVLTEGDVFKVTIPLKNSDVNIQKSDIDNKKTETEIQNPEVNARVSDIQVSKVSLETLMQLCKEKSYNVLKDFLGG